MNKKKSGKKTIGIAMAVLILGSAFAMLAPASVADHPHEILNHHVSQSPLLASLLEKFHYEHQKGREN